MEPPMLALELELQEHLRTIGLDQLEILGQLALAAKKLFFYVGVITERLSMTKDHFLMTG